MIPVAAPTEEERKFHYPWRFWRDLPPWRQGRDLRPEPGTAAPRTGRRLRRSRGMAAGLRRSMTSKVNLSNAATMSRSSGCTCPRGTTRSLYSARADRLQVPQDHRRGLPQPRAMDDYVKAVDQTILRTTSDAAPWHVIPANDKRLARVTALQVNKVWRGYCAKPEAVRRPRNQLAGYSSPPFGNPPPTVVMCNVVVVAVAGPAGNCHPVCSTFLAKSRPAPRIGPRYPSRTRGSSRRVRCPRHCQGSGSSDQSPARWGATAYVRLTPIALVDLWESSADTSALRGWS